MLTYLGRRFSQDMTVVDQELPFALIDLISAAVQTVVGAILMCLVTGYFALTLPAVIFIIYGKYFLLKEFVEEKLIMLVPNLKLYKSST